MDLKYRLSDPEEFDCFDEAEEYEVLSGIVGDMCERMGRRDILDNLLTIANICESRSITQPLQSDWYAKVSLVVRLALMELATEDMAPNRKLENPELYFPETGEQKH